MLATRVHNMICKFHLIRIPKALANWSNWIEFSNGCSHKAQSCMQAPSKRKQAAGIIIKLITFFFSTFADFQLPISFASIRPKFDGCFVKAIFMDLAASWKLIWGICEPKMNAEYIHGNGLLFYVLPPIKGTKQIFSRSPFTGSANLTSPSLLLLTIDAVC